MLYAEAVIIQRRVKIGKKPTKYTRDNHGLQNLNVFFKSSVALQTSFFTTFFKKEVHTRKSLIYMNPYVICTRWILNIQYL